MGNGFQNKIDNPSEITDVIINTLLHPRKDEARRFLSLVDQFVCHYLKSNEEGLCFPILRIPNCPEYVREILVRYLILRLSLTYNNDTWNNIFAMYFGIRYLGELDKKGTKRYKEHDVPFKKYLKEIKDKCQGSLLAEDGHKNIIICREADSKEKRNDFVYYSDFLSNDLFTKGNVSVSNDLTVLDLRKTLKKKKGSNLIVDNLFMAYTNNECCNSFSKTGINLLNEKYGLGIKRCFVFDFSSEPYISHKVFNRRHFLCQRLPELNEKEIKNYPHFTSLPEEDSRFLFSLDAIPAQHLYVEDQHDQLFYTELIGTVIDELEYKTQERNILSLCLSNRLIESYQRRMEEKVPGFNSADYSMSFQCLQDCSLSKIRPLLAKHIEYEESIAVVIDRNTPYEMKRDLDKLFDSIERGIKVKFYSYVDLKPTQKKANNISENCIIVLQYRPHFSGTVFHKYPNSFDPFILESHQRILDITLGFAFDNYYKWNLYDYNVLNAKLANSAFRKACFGAVPEPKLPSIEQLPVDIEDDDEQSSTSRYVSMIVEFADGKKQHIQDNQLLICELDESVIITCLSDLKDDGKLSNVKSIQKLDEIEALLSDFMEKQSKKSSDSEHIIRLDAFKAGRITQAEVDSKDELWRLLLRKAVIKRNDEVVYKELMANVREDQRIHLNSFKKWSEPSYDIILPLQKVMQKAVFEYLGLTPLYLKIMKAKKIAQKKGTRNINYLMDHFLMDVLCNDLNEEFFESIKDAEINDMLQLDTLQDLQTLTDMLRNEIHLKQVKQISES